MRIVMIGAAMLALAGCESGAADEGAANNAMVTNAVAPEAVGQGAATNAASLILTGTGLRATDAAGGPAIDVPFGSPEDRAIRQISAAFGAPDQRATNDDCPAGPMQVATWNKGLSANFQEGKFVGWTGAVDLKTAAGIGFGSRRADLMNAYPGATIEQSSLGTEFTADGISGVLESDASDAAVSDMWAGVSCVAR